MFGFWGIVLVLAMVAMAGGAHALAYAESRNYTEPLFVFVVMVMAASRPILMTVVRAVDLLAGMLPVATPIATTWLCLAAIPLLGSLITEPAAMTIAALMMAPSVFAPHIPERVKYLALGVLFVNVSIGGTLTSYAAPPVLMVATTWQWDSAWMLSQFGWKAAIATLVNATLATWVLRRHLTSAPPAPAEAIAVAKVPFLVVVWHLALLAGVVVLVHHPWRLMGLFHVPGFTQAYERYQSPLILREALLVASSRRVWWCSRDAALVAATIVSGLAARALLRPARADRDHDNAALTYLGRPWRNSRRPGRTCSLPAPSQAVA